MAEVNFIPGPWVYDPNDRDDLIIKDERGRKIAEVTDNREYTLIQCQAHAKLIAAAPDLLQAALHAYEHYQTDNSTVGSSIRLLLKIAIEKATT